MHNEHPIRTLEHAMYLRTSLSTQVFAACVAIAAAATAPQQVQAADAGYRVAARQVLEGPVRWDYLAVDSARHRVFLTRGDHVDVFDAQTRAVVGTIADTAGVHGVALAADLDRGYTSNGGTDSVTVFELASLRPVATVGVGGKPDSIVYDPASKRVFVANGRDKTLSVIDAVSNRMIKTIGLHGSPETAVVNGKGELFVAIEDKNAVAVIDTAAMTVLRQIDIAASCDEPAGLAIDAATDRLFVGCHNAKMAIVDGRTGKVLAAPAIGKGNDATAYDPMLKRALASNGEGTMTVIDGTAPYAVLQTVPTMQRARTMALDPVSHQVFLVAAEAAAGTPPPGTRPALKPGTFTLLTVTP
jgi:YVTN family beta-propeller protein